MTTNAHPNREIKPAPSTRSLLDKWSLIADAIMRDPDLTAAAKCVAARLMWHMNCRWEECWPKQTTLAADLGMSPTTVLDSIKALAASGWLIVRKRPGTSSAYRFDFDKQLPRDDQPQQEGAPPESEVDQPPENGAEHGNNLTGESSPSLSASPKEKAGKGSGTKSADKPIPWTKRPIAERMGQDGFPVTQEGDTDWNAQVWEIDLAAMLAIRKANDLPPMSGGQARGRIGKMIKDFGGAYAAHRAIAQILKAEPGGCPFDYLAGLKRSNETVEEKTAKNFDAPIDYSY